MNKNYHIEVKTYDDVSGHGKELASYIYGKYDNCMIDDDHIDAMVEDIYDRMHLLEEEYPDETLLEMHCYNLKGCKIIFANPMDKDYDSAVFIIFYNEIKQYIH
ncbi:hypothetical protein [Phocaeicola paurosaccharolyticus]|uniref:hypothetical protein n=1 Tax=Phocaeicola paurosaccharolyticus TaxID=732242 RepID=UPI002FE31906